MNPDARVLLTTFSDTLANALQTKLRRLLGNEPRLAERIDVHSLNAIGLRLYKSHVGQATIASREVVRELLQEAASAVDGHKFALHFLMTEWEQVVDAWQLDDWEAYRDVARLGRKTRIPEPKRKVLWSIFERVRAGLKARKLITYAELFSSLAAAIIQDQEAGLRFRGRGRGAGHHALLMSGSLPPWAEVVATLYFSRVISGSASSSSRFRGRRWALIFGDVRERCA